MALFVKTETGQEMPAEWSRNAGRRMEGRKGGEKKDKRAGKDQESLWSSPLP